MVKRYEPVCYRDRGFTYAGMQECNSPTMGYVIAAEYDALAARLAEAERDAARYRWLRDMRNNKPAYATSTGEREAERIVNRLFGFEWDHAIDAAMTADSADAAIRCPCNCALPDPGKACAGCGRINEAPKDAKNG